MHFGFLMLQVEMTYDVFYADCYIYFPEEAVREALMTLVKETWIHFSASPWSVHPAPRLCRASIADRHASESHLHWGYLKQLQALNFTQDSGFLLLSTKDYWQHPLRSLVLQIKSKAWISEQHCTHTHLKRPCQNFIWGITCFFCLRHCVG